MPSRKAVVQLAPKRRIERFRSKINVNFDDNPALDLDLHVAEDSKTLVRMLVDLDVHKASWVDESESYNILISVAPRGTQIVIASVAQLLDDPVPIQEIISKLGSFESHLFL